MVYFDATDVTWLDVVSGIAFQWFTVGQEIHEECKYIYLRGDDANSVPIWVI